MSARQCEVGPLPGRGGEGVKSGGQKPERVRVIDWEQPANNDFLLVRQFSVTGAEGEEGRRISEE